MRSCSFEAYEELHSNSLNNAVFCVDVHSGTCCNEHASQASHSQSTVFAHPKFADLPEEISEQLSKSERLGGRRVQHGTSRV